MKPKSVSPATAADATESAANRRTEFLLAETIIEEGGVMRCCLGTVALEYEKPLRDVKIGDKSECQHCHTKFTLVSVPVGMNSAYTRKILDRTPVWKPDWQLEVK